MTEENEEVDTEEVELNLDGVDLRTFEIVDERDPNDHRKLETGRKQKRRLKQKITMSNETGAYTTGKKHANYTGTRKLGNNKGLPTGIKLTAGRGIVPGKIKSSAT